MVSNQESLPLVMEHVESEDKLPWKTAMILKLSFYIKCKLKGDEDNNDRREGKE